MGTARLLRVLLCGGIFIVAGWGAGLPEPKVPIRNPHASMAELFTCLHGKTTLVSAHRGGPVPGYPESAIETFANTLAKEPALLETDVRTSSDGVLMVMHDDTLDRTTTGHGKVSETPWAKMATLHLKDNDGAVTPFRIPTLADILEWMRGRGLVALDMKEGTDNKAVAAAVRSAKAEPYASVVVYSAEQAKAFHDADPDITVIYSFEKLADFETLRQTGVPDNRTMAWMGIDAQRRDLWKIARQRKIPLIYGTLFFGDYAMTMTGNYAHFGELVREPIDILPTDYADIAYREISKVNSAEKALRTCRATGW
jgi:glycerophosphoryl diester phosphodiesterase